MAASTMRHSLKKSPASWQGFFMTGYGWLGCQPSQ